MKNKPVAGAIVVLVIILIVFVGIASVVNTNEQIDFDQNNVVLKVAVLSDTHIHEIDGKTSKRLAAALEQLNEKANGKLDALLITGDLTDYGLPEQIDELKGVIDNSGVDLNKTRFIAALGNHEYYDHLLKGAEWKGGYLIKDVFGDASYEGATSEEIRAGNYHTVVNRYDFIVVNCAVYEKVGVKYNDDDIRWLEKQLAEAANKHPGQPIFVGSHPNITRTNLGSNEGSYWAGRDLYDVLKNYPQVIYFCGHLHFPENDERSIWQGDFTTIGVGSTYYLSNHKYDDDNGNVFIDIVSGFQTFDASLTPSQGLYLEVDKNNNVRMSRLDFTNREEIKKPWIIPAPKDDKSHLLYYTPEQGLKKIGKTAPVFSDTANIKEISKTNGVYQFKFIQAKDNDLVYSYQVSFVDNDTGKKIKTISTLSDFYMHANPEEMTPVLTKTIANADSILAPFSLSYSKDYYLQIVAIDCFGQKSEPIVSDVITPNKQ